MRNYNSTGSRDPIWTQVTCDPEENFRISQERVIMLIFIVINYFCVLSCYSCKLRQVIEIVGLK